MIKHAKRRYICHTEVSEKVQNCPLYVGAQFIEPDDNGFR